MSYYEKYQKYKIKYIDNKNKNNNNIDTLIGGTWNSGYWPFIEIRNKIKKYIKEKDYKELRDILIIIQKKYACSTSCWINLIKNVKLTQYWSSLNTNNFYLYPYNEIKDATFMTDWYKKPNNNIIGYDFMKKFISLAFVDILMLDYDIKDDIKDKDPTPEQLKSQLMEIINKIQFMVNEFYKFGIYLKFLLINTDRGYHLFLINKTGYNKNLFLVELMTTVCNDQWYSAFCYTNGWSIRLNKKEPTDYIAELAFNEEFKSCLTNSKNIPENRFDYLGLSRNFKFYSKFYEREIDFKYPNITDKQLIFIEPKLVSEQGVSDTYNCLISKEDKSEIVFNKICYHYYLIKYFKEISDEQIIKLESSISDITLGLTDNTILVTNLRDDLSIIAEYFGLKNNEVINDSNFINISK
jgi:hypothetical protein